MPIKQLSDQTLLLDYIRTNKNKGVREECQLNFRLENNKILARRTQSDSWSEISKILPSREREIIVLRVTKFYNMITHTLSQEQEALPYRRPTLSTPKIRKKVSFNDQVTIIQPAPKEKPPLPPRGKPPKIPRHMRFQVGLPDLNHPPTIGQYDT